MSDEISRSEAIQLLRESLGITEKAAKLALWRHVPPQRRAGRFNFYLRKDVEAYIEARKVNKVGLKRLAGARAWDDTVFALVEQFGSAGAVFAAVLADAIRSEDYDYITSEDGQRIAEMLNIDVDSLIRAVRRIEKWQRERV